MIVCPNCSHQNPDGAAQCEACYTPLPATTHCPNCGATVQMDANFCGQCGFNLLTSSATPSTAVPSPITAASAAPEPEPVLPDPLIPPDPLVVEPVTPQPAPEAPAATIATPVTPGTPTTSEPVPATAVAEESKTQLQIQTAHLLHLRTNTKIELPSNLTVIHIGKPNDRIPPDIDVSGFPDSEIVSRIHADIRLEGDAYYIEDTGSSNGTYINNIPLPVGNRHRLRAGDRVALGKGDRVSFLFNLT